MSIDYIAVYIESISPFSFIAIIPSVIAMYIIRWLFFIFYVQLFGTKCKAKVMKKNIATITNTDSDGTTTIHFYFMTVIYGKQYGDKYYFYTVRFRVRRWEYNDSEINSMVNIKYLKWNCCWFTCKDNSIGYHHCHGVAWSHNCCNIIKGIAYWIKVLVVSAFVVASLYYVICIFSFNDDDTGLIRLVRCLFIVLNGWINVILIRFIVAPLFCGLVCCKMKKYFKNPFGIIKPPHDHDQYQSVSKVQYDKLLGGVVELGNLTKIIDLIDIKLQEETK